MRISVKILLASLLIIGACVSKTSPDNLAGTEPPLQTEQEQNPEPKPDTPETATSYGAYKHVVIIGVDGGGAFFKDTDTPRCDEIFNGQATTYRSKTSFPTISAQCWGSILHGVLPEFHKLTNESIKTTPYPDNSLYPSIFRVAREAMPEAEFHIYPLSPAFITQGGPGCVAVQYNHL